MKSISLRLIICFWWLILFAFGLNCVECFLEIHFDSCFVFIWETRWQIACRINRYLVLYISLIFFDIFKLLVFFFLKMHLRNWWSNNCRRINNLFCIMGISSVLALLYDRLTWLFWIKNNFLTTLYNITIHNCLIRFVVLLVISIIFVYAIMIILINISLNILFFTLIVSITLLFIIIINFRLWLSIVNWSINNLSLRLRWISLLILSFKIYY